jgi:hypothetical protein
MFTGKFAGIERLLIDGNNLLHRVSGSAEPGALRLVIAKLRSALPPHVSAIVMLDGHPAPGTGRSEKVTSNLEIRHAGSLSADEALLNLVRDRPGWTTLVSDDRALRDKARSLGASTQRLDWLEDILGRGGGPSAIGRRR